MVLIQTSLHMPRWYNKSFSHLSQLVAAYSSHSSKVAQTILKVSNSPNPGLRNPVGKDAESIFKVRAELSDKEVEQWARESYMDKKGFIRQ